MDDGPAPDLAASVSAVTVGAAVLTAPWFLGMPGTIQLACAAAALSLLAAGLAVRFGGGVLPIALWPARGGLLLGAAPASSPMTGEALESPDGGLTGSLRPVSVAASSTREALAVLVAGTLAFLLAARAGGSVAGRRVVWWGVAGTAAAFSLAGIADRLGLPIDFGFERFAGRGDAVRLKFFANFNRSHAAELLNLGLAATLGLLTRRGGWPAAACGAIIAAGVIVAGSRAGVAAIPAGLLLAGLAITASGRLATGPLTTGEAKAG
ncbi:MAG: hypothetical protein AAF907_18440, partial [Planctomycetota bacterium]